MIVRRIGRIEAYRQYCEYEFSGPSPSLLWRLRGLLHGHPGRALAMLPPGAYERRDFISFARQRRRESVYNRQLSLALFEKLSQKLWLDRVMPGAAPPVLGYIAGDRLVSLEGSGAVPLDAIVELARSRGGLFLKPSDSGRGMGALRIEAHEGGALSANGAMIAPEGLAAMLREARFQSYLVSALIQPDAWSDAFFPGTLNTLRVLTGTRREDRRALLLAATMKTARRATGPTDNWQAGRGGIAARVDVDTGALAAGLGWDELAGNRRYHDRHPETGAQLAGAIVPAWRGVRRVMLELASLLPAPGLVGWDVALTPLGPVVVELNTTPGLEIHQCHGSIQETAEQRAYFKELRLI